MLEIKNFTKNYTGVELYNNFYLSVEGGEVTCILGESGSGKTTLLNAVAGLIEYDGAITKQKCSFVFQSPRLVPCLTVKDNLLLICKDIDKINYIIKKVGLEDKFESYPAELSGGQAQRVSIARAFLFEGDAFLLDEPFSSLDLKLKKEIAELFFEMWRDSGKPVLFVTHDIDEAVNYSDRILILKKGKLIFDKKVTGDRKNLREELIETMLV